MSTGTKSSMLGFTLIVTGAAVCVVILLLVFKAATETTREEAKAAIVESPEAKEERVKQETKLKELADRQVAARIAREKALDKVKRTEADIAAYDAEIKRWDNEVLALQKNEAGKKIAASDEAAAQYQTLVSEYTPDPNATKEFRRDVEKIRRQIEENDVREEDDDYYAPSTTLLVELENIRNSVVKLVRRTSEARHDATTLGYGESPAKMTLEEKLAELDRRASDERRKAISAAARAEYEKGTAELAAAEQEKVRAATDEQLEKVNAETAKLNLEKLKVAAKSNHKMLGLIRPLTTPGMKLTGKKNAIDPEPVSYSLLISGGYLGEDAVSLGKLAQIFFKFNSNDRKPLWPQTGPGSWTYPRTYDEMLPKDQQNIRAVRDFLEEYGEALVELGKLSP